MRVKCFFFIFSLFLCVFSYGQQSEAVKKYIDDYKDLAMQEMIRTGVPASITLAQGIHESGAGNSKLALSSNNHFGIKCKSNWSGETVRHDDDAKGECFRKYPSPVDSYKDHSDFLKNGARYASLFSLDPGDYAGWANGLKQAGYATNPKYPQVIIKLVEDYNLQQYSLMALNRKVDTMKVAKANDDIKVPVVIAPAEKVDDDLPVNTVTAKHISYPTGLFKINETKVVYVKKGTFFLALAKKYDVDLSKLFEINDIKKAEQTEKDQLVYLQKKRKTGAIIFHVVQAGETLLDIAQAEGIRLENLLELNQLKNGDQPAAGEKLYLKTKRSSKPLLAKGN